MLRATKNVPQRKHRVYILILNWNGWADTIECLESVFHSDYPDFEVVVCDNDSSDNSMAFIKDWADGIGHERTGSQGRLCHLDASPVGKPIAYRELVARAGVADGHGQPHSDVALTLIQTGGNLGFAGGNNVGLRYALAQADCAYVWLLNNDTVIEPDALSRLVAQLGQEPEAGMCGSTLRYFHAPETIQAMGGATYNKWTGLSREIGNGQVWEGTPSTRGVKGALSYVSGASMLVTRQFLSEVGLMCEEYFLYFEELDWALRARGKFTLTYAPDSIVYHKEGATIGSGKSAKRSVVAEFYSFNNRLKVTRKFFPLALPTVMAVGWLQVMKRLARGQWPRARLMAEILLGLRQTPPLRR